MEEWLKEEKTTSIFEYIDIFWSKKKIILTVLFLSLFLAFAYNKKFNPISYTASAEIGLITNESYNNLKNLATFEIFDVNFLAEKEKVKEKFQVVNGEIIFSTSCTNLICDQDNLFKFYLEELRKPENHFSIAKELKIFDSKDFNNVIDYENALRSVYSKFEISEPKKDKYNTFNWSVKLKLKDKSTIRPYLLMLDNIANVKSQEKLTANFNFAIDSLKIQKKNLLEKLSLEITNSIDDFNRDINQRVSYLDEQAQIATKATEIIQNSTYPLKGSIDTNSDNLYYLRGYDLISKEKELVSKRSGESNFNKKYIELKEKYRALDQNSKIEQAVESFNRSPIAKDDFKTGKLFVEGMKITKNSSRFEVIFIMVISGLLLSMLYIILSNRYRSNV